MGAPPILTPQQRADALAKAATSRKRRAEVKSKIKSGDYTIDTVLELAIRAIFAMSGTLDNFS